MLTQASYYYDNDKQQAFEKILLTSNTVVLLVTPFVSSSRKHWLVWPVRSYGMGRKLEMRLDAFWPLFKSLTINNHLTVFGLKQDITQLPVADAREFEALLHSPYVSQLKL